MVAFKITKFQGTMPRVSPELLPDTAAQVAKNCKLYSGDLIPRQKSLVVGGTLRATESDTIFGVRDPVTDVLKWLAWEEKVDVATPATDGSVEQRIYYTGNGPPKVTTYAMATAGAGPYPAAHYTLGLRLPVQVPTAVATVFTAVVSATVGRDAGDNVTLVTGTAHNLKSGAVATISGFAYVTGTYTQASGSATILVTMTAHSIVSGETVYLEFTSGAATTNGYVVTSTGAGTFNVVAAVVATAATSGGVRLDIRDFNIVTEVTVLSATALSYFSPGASMTTKANTDGDVDLGGRVQARSYVYTYYTPWDEESIASEPSTELFIKEGQIVTLGNLPQVKPNGDNFIRGLRLYRTLASSESVDAEFFRLATLWFPNTITYVSRVANVSSVVFLHPHNMIEDDRFKIADCSRNTFDITGGIVVSIPDDYTITYAQVAVDVASDAATGGLYYDVSEDPPTTTARYWGFLGDYTFTDDFSFRSLTDILTTTDYKPPPNNLRGLTVMRNNILAGFVDNNIYFAEPGKFHAWPDTNKVTVEHPIMGLASVDGTLVVLTKAYPYLISGDDPATMAVQRLDARYPCVSRRSIVNMGYGVVYASHDGLAVIALSGGGPQILTAAVHSGETWNTAVDPTSVIGAQYRGAYLGAHTTGSFIYERLETPAGHITTSSSTFAASWYDPQDNALYTTLGAAGTIERWDDDTQPAETFTWKSKTIVFPDPINLGAARVIADFDVQLPYLWGTWDTVWSEELEEWPPDITVYSWGTADVNWGLADTSWYVDAIIAFNLFADKILIFSTELTDSNMFRLPTGYRTDTFAVGVSGTVRVRAIHVAETPAGLKQA